MVSIFQDVVAMFVDRWCGKHRRCGDYMFKDVVAGLEIVWVGLEMWWRGFNLGDVVAFI